MLINQKKEVCITLFVYVLEAKVPILAKNKAKSRLTFPLGFKLLMLSLEVQNQSYL